MLSKIEEVCFYYGKYLKKEAILIKSTEEAGEFVQALSKLSLKLFSEASNKELWVNESIEEYLMKVHEEMVDLYFMILQLRTSLDRPDMWDAIITGKIERAEERIKKKMTAEHSKR